MPGEGSFPKGREGGAQGADSPALYGEPEVLDFTNKKGRMRVKKGSRKLLRKKKVAKKRFVSRFAEDLEDA